MRAGYRGDLAVGVIDGTTGGPSRSGYHGVFSGRVTVKWQNATLKVVPKHSLNLGEQPFAPLT
jgi:hypothetical protein